METLLFWFWVALAALLLVLEILIPGFFFLWIGIAALGSAVLSFLDLHAAYQISMFAVTAPLLIFIFREKRSSTEAPGDIRGKRCIVLEETGERSVLILVDGEKREALCSGDNRIEKGTAVRVEDIVDDRLIVTPADEKAGSD